jgi:hypothetical protein
MCPALSTLIAAIIANAILFGTVVAVEELLVRQEVLLVEGAGSHAVNGQYVRRPGVMSAGASVWELKLPNEVKRDKRERPRPNVVVEIVRSERYSRVLDDEGEEITLPAVGQQYWTISAVSNGIDGHARTALYFANSVHVQPPSEGWQPLKGRRPVPSSISILGNISIHPCDRLQEKSVFSAGDDGACWAKIFKGNQRAPLSEANALASSSGRHWEVSRSRINQAPSPSWPNRPHRTAVENAGEGKDASNSMHLSFDVGVDSYLRCEGATLYSSRPAVRWCRCLFCGFLDGRVVLFKAPKHSDTEKKQEEERQANMWNSEMILKPLSRPYQQIYFDEPTTGDGYETVYGTIVYSNEATAVRSPYTQSGKSWKCDKVIDEPSFIVSVPWIRHVWHLLFDLIQPLFNTVRRSFGTGPDANFFYGADKGTQRDLRIWLYHRQERDSDILPEENIEEEIQGTSNNLYHIERELELADTYDRPTRMLRLLSRKPFGTKRDLDTAGLVCFHDLHVGLDPRGTPFAFGVQRKASAATLTSDDLAAAIGNPESPVGKMVEEQLAFKQFLHRRLRLFWNESSDLHNHGAEMEARRAENLFGRLDGLTADEEKAMEELNRAERLFGHLSEDLSQEEEASALEAARAAKLFGELETKDVDVAQLGTEKITKRNLTSVRREQITIIRRTAGGGVRGLTNHVELMARLAAKLRYYQEARVVSQEAVLESMTFGEQLVLFEETTILFGVHGQALANTVFLRDGAVLILVNEPKGFGLKWMFSNLALTSRVHVVLIRRPEDSCDDTKGWGGLKDHISFNRNVKNGTQLDEELFELAIEKALQLRSLPFENTTSPSITIVPEGKCTPVVSDRNFKRTEL